MDKKDIYCIYEEKNDITFVMMDTMKNGKTISIECIGFYFGKWDASDITSLNTISLKAVL